MFKLMVTRLTLVVLLFALAGGVVSGTPLHSSNDQMMDCCDKARSKDTSRAAQAARVCCAINCSDSAPTSSVTTFNFAPSSFAISKSIVEQTAVLFPKDKAVLIVTSYCSRQPLPRIYQPKYIQHNSFLI